MTHDFVEQSKAGKLIVSHVKKKKKRFKCQGAKARTIECVQGVKYLIVIYETNWSLVPFSKPHCSAFYLEKYLTSDGASGVCQRFVSFDSALLEEPALMAHSGFAIIFFFHHKKIQLLFNILINGLN